MTAVRPYMDIRVQIGDVHIYGGLLRETAYGTARAREKGIAIISEAHFMDYLQRNATGNQYLGSQK
jgi:hypothetical protein